MDPGAVPVVVVVPDVSPLIHLASAGQLDLLHAFGRVVVMDVVVHEATGDLAKPWAGDIAAWLAAGAGPGAAHPVQVATTEIGEACRLARQADPAFRLRGAGERAIRDWLVESLPGFGGSALVVYEDRKVPALIRRERLDQVVIVATTRAVLEFAEQRGVIASAEAVWTDIMTGARSASPRIDMQVVRPADEC
jgi:hypothetical protein